MVDPGFDLLQEAIRSDSPLTAVEAIVSGNPEFPAAIGKSSADGFRTEHIPPGGVHSSRLARGYIPKVSVSGAPGLYVKDITWAGRSVLNARLTIGAEAPLSELRVVVAQDGSTFTAHVTDNKSEPLANTTVVITPANTPTESDFAARLIKGEQINWVRGLLLLLRPANTK